MPHRTMTPWRNAGLAAAVAAAALAVPATASSAVAGTVTGDTGSNIDLHSALGGDQ
jgi:hypothetical protein